MTSRYRPLIGINGLIVPGETPRLELATRYANAILKAGGVPLVIPPIGGPSDVERVVERLDGLLLPGGDDFDTLRLGLGPVHPKADLTPGEKQDFDVALSRCAIERRVPVLGICYGMQLLGLVEGAHLHQHIPDDRPGAREHSGGVVHAVSIDEGTRLARLYREPVLDVVSRHHQALASVHTPWRVCARDDQGLIEAIEREAHPFAIGVQWHPEIASEGSLHDRLFQGFIGAAAIFATQRMLGARA